MLNLIFMIKNILTAIITAMALSAAAQFQPTANLTIFSEDGNKFYLILNGERQNNQAETNIRVEELVNPYYSTKIIFEDKTLGEISKSALMLTDADGIYQDVTYKIKKDKNGKLSLKYFSSIPVQPNMPPSRPQGVAVYQFGNTTHMPLTFNSAGTVVTQTTTTQTTTGTGANVGVNVGGMGVNMNVNINDPMVNGTTTQTVTTTTNGTQITTTRPAGQPDPRPNPYYNSGCNGPIMNGSDFSAALDAIHDGSFEDTKFTTAKQIADGACLSTDQIIAMCNEFSFEKTKLDFAKYAHSRCLDKNNYFKVNKVFSFDSSKSELSKYVSTNR